MCINMFDTLNLQKDNQRLKEKRLHLRANKDNPPSPSSSDTESSEDVDPNYGKMCFQVFHRYQIPMYWIL